ncbi:MAG: nitrogenase associated protein E [Clostridiales bacterium]|jgi:nitrogenase molybdenum-cofactor synthesis protein NifE|nr:nitrogenase associated protein E [Clostridiales bacterium]
MRFAESIVFSGRLSTLYQLAKEKKIDTALQGSHTRPCKFWTAMKILSGMERTIVIAHGPSGCAYGVKQAYKLINCRNSGTPYEAVLTTSVNEKTIIYGGEKELREALLEVDRKYRPDVIVVATSCATGIIGDNVDAVVEGARAQIGAKLLPIHCEGFAGEYRSGFDLVFGELAKLMDPPTEESRKALSRSVNIIGSKMGPERTEVDTDVKELIRLVKGMGAQINAVIAGGCSLDELRRAPSAAVNCGLCYDIGYALGREMERIHGTPMNSTILPYGIEATKRWLATAARHLGLEKEADDLCGQEYEAIRAGHEVAKQRLIGKIGVIDGKDAVKSLSIAHMLERDFGMRAIICNFHPWSAEARQTSIDYLLEAGIDPEIIITKGALAFGRYESMRQSEEELLDYLGGLTKDSAVYFGSSLSFPSIPLVDLNAILNRPRFGYKGALKVAQCICKSFDCASRGRSRLTKEMVFPQDPNASIGAGNLGMKASASMPDCTFYGKGGMRRCLND